MTEIELKKRTIYELIEHLVFQVSVLRVQFDLLKKEVEELKNDNGE